MLDDRPRRTALIAVLTAVFVLAQLVSVMLPGAPGAKRAHAAVPAAGHYFGLPTSQVVFDQTLAANASVSVKLRGVAGTGIPDSADVSALAGNLVVFTPTVNGNVSVYPAGAAKPAVGQVYFYATDNISNFIIAELAADGRATITNNSSASVRIGFNAQGYYTKAATGTATDNGATYAPLPGGRVVSTAEGTGVPNTDPLGPNETLTFDLSGKVGLPEEGLGPVVLSVTARQPTTGGIWYQVYTAGGTRPAWAHGSTDPNMGQRTTTVVVQPDADGKVSIYNQSGSASIHFLVDVQGWYVPSTGTAPGGSFTPLPVKRILDTAGGVGVPTPGPVAGEEIVDLQVTGAGGVPSTGVHAVALNLWITGAETNGYLRVFPTGGTQTLTVIVGYQRLRVAGNLVSTHLSADGKLSIRNISTGQVNLYADVYGYWKAPSKPQPPTAVKADVGDSEAFVSWTPPTDDGGASITEYTVTASPGGATKTVNGNAPGAALTDLTNGTAYTFSVKAVNGVGTSVASEPSAPVTPRQTRQLAAPYITQVVARDEAAKVFWEPPQEAADSVVSYEIQASPGGSTATVDGATREHIFPGLANGTEYRFTITPINGNGRGVTSAASPAVTPGPAGPPTEPAGLMAVPLDGRIDVQWVPSVDGGSPITGYTVTAEPGQHSVTTGPATTVTALTGLNNGTAYKITVTAANRAGTSPAAVAENVTPQASRVPQPPTSLQAAPGENGTVSLTWQPPADFGTDPITNYTVTTSPGGGTTTVTEPKANITGLDPGTAYTFTVAANSAAGGSVQTAPTTAIRPQVVTKQAPIVLNAESAASLRRIRADRTLIFASTTPQLAALKAGDLLAIGATTAAPHGFYGRVAGVETTSTFLAVSTTSATLEEAFTQADFSVETGLESPDTPAGAQELAPGVEVSEPIINGKTAAQLKTARGFSGSLIREGNAFILRFDIESGSRFGTQDRYIRPGLKFQGNITLRGTTRLVKENGETRLRSDLRYDFKGTIDVGVLVDLDDVFQKVLASKFHRFYTLTIGGAPIVFVGRWVSRLTVAGSGMVGISSPVSFQNGGVNVDCLISGPSGGPSCAAPLKRDPVSRPLDATPRGEGTVKVAFPFEYEVLLGGLVGPALAVGPYVELTLDTTAENFATATFGIQAGFAVNPCLLFSESSVWRKDDLLVWSIPFWQTGPFKGIAVTPSAQEMLPGESTQLTARLEGVTPEAIHWRVRSGPGSVSSDGLFTANSLGMAIIEAYTLDEEYVGTGAVLVSYGGPISAPGDVQVRPTVEGLAVRWDQVPDSFNRDVTHYEVQATPMDGSAPTRMVAVDEPGRYNARIDGLNPNTDYQVRVRAWGLGGPGPEGFPTKTDGSETYPTPLEMSLGENGDGTGAYDIARDQYMKPDSTGIAGHGGAAISDLNLFFFTKAESNLAPLEVREKNRDAIYLVRLNLATHRTELASRNGSTPVEATTAANQKSVAVSGDGSTVAFRDTSGDVLIHRIYEYKTWRVTNAQGIPALSHDGREAAYITRNVDGVTKAVRHQLGQAPKVLDSCGAGCTYIDDIDISADGNKILISAVSDLNYYSMFLYNHSAGTTPDLLPNRTDVLEIAQSGKISDDGTTIAFWYERRGETLGLAVKELDNTRIGAGHVRLFAPEPLSPMDISSDGTYVAYREPNITDDGARLKVYASQEPGDFNVPQAGAIDGSSNRPLSAQLTTHMLNQPGLIYTLYPADGGNNAHPGVWSWVNVT